ncbi:MAG: glycosyltransferase family 1 protein [Lachnospiraceae bacterium]|nr:glycosyltransferase family 1 protein [Lachnospiraceae bacterium]
MERMKILYIGASNIGRGGRSTIVYNLSKHLDNTCICDFFCDGGVKPSAEIITEIHNRNGHVYIDQAWEDNYIKRQLIWFGRLRNVLRQGSYDVIHINMDHAVEAIRAIMGCKIFGGKKIVVHAHSADFVKETLVIKHIMAKLLRPLVFVLCDAQIACSKKAAEFMYGKLAAKTGKIILLNNGIDVEKYKYNPNMRRRLRTTYFLNDKLVIGHVGNFYYPKNHKRLIQIFKRIHEKRNNTVLMLVGEGELKKAIYQQVIKEKLEEYVFFMGERNDVSDLLQIFDVFLLPSYFEGFGIAGVEAQAAGLPCFFSDTIPKKAKLTENVKYISLNENDDVWADEILNVIPMERKDESERIKFAGFDIRESAGKLLEIYYSILT